MEHNYNKIDSSNCSIYYGDITGGSEVKVIYFAPGGNMESVSFNRLNLDPKTIELPDNTVLIACNNSDCFSVGKKFVNATNDFISTMNQNGVNITLGNENIYEGFSMSCGAAPQNVVNMIENGINFKSIILMDNGLHCLKFNNPTLYANNSVVQESFKDNDTNFYIVGGAALKISPKSNYSTYSEFDVLHEEGNIDTDHIYLLNMYDTNGHGSIPLMINNGYKQNGVYTTSFLNFLINEGDLNLKSTDGSGYYQFIRYDSETGQFVEMNLDDVKESCSSWKSSEYYIKSDNKFLSEGLTMLNEGIGELENLKINFSVSSNTEVPGCEAELLNGVINAIKSLCNKFRSEIQAFGSVGNRFENFDDSLRSKAGDLNVKFDFDFSKPLSEVKLKKFDTTDLSNEIREMNVYYDNHINSDNYDAFQSGEDNGFVVTNGTTPYSRNNDGTIFANGYNNVQADPLGYQFLSPSETFDKAINVNGNNHLKSTNSIEQGGTSAVTGNKTDFVSNQGGTSVVTGSTTDFVSNQGGTSAMTGSTTDSVSNQGGTSAVTGNTTDSVSNQGGISNVTDKIDSSKIIKGDKFDLTGKTNGSDSNQGGTSAVTGNTTDSDSNKNDNIVIDNNSNQSNQSSVSSNPIEQNQEEKSDVIHIDTEADNKSIPVNTEINHKNNKVETDNSEPYREQYIIPGETISKKTSTNNDKVYGSINNYKGKNIYINLDKTSTKSNLINNNVQNDVEPVSEDNDVPVIDYNENTNENINDNNVFDYSNNNDIPIYDDTDNNNDIPVYDDSNNDIGPNNNNENTNDNSALKTTGIASGVGLAVGTAAYAANNIITRKDKYDSTYQYEDMKSDNIEQESLDEQYKEYYADKN